MHSIVLTTYADTSQPNRWSVNLKGTGQCDLSAPSLIGMDAICAPTYPVKLR